MARRSMLGAFVSGTRQLLALQLFVAVVAVGAAAWTLAVSNGLVRERERLRERVIQLEEELGANNIVVPAPAPVVDATPALSALDAYPPSAQLPAQSTAQEESSVFNPREVFDDLFAPAPPMRVVVLHTRAQSDTDRAREIAQALVSDANVRIVVGLLTPRDPRESGYTYFDGRQSRAAADLMATFNDAARRAEIAAWSAQMRGQALPAQGEYTPDRLDIVLPLLPAPPPPPEPPPPAAIVQPSP